MIQMIIHYEVKQNLLDQHKEAIEKISDTLPNFDADSFSCSQDTQQNVFIESCLVPTEAHYHALKKLRQTRSHSVFGSLDECVPGGLVRMDFIAIKQKR